MKVCITISRGESEAKYYQVDAMTSEGGIISGYNEKNLGEALNLARYLIRNNPAVDNCRIVFYQLGEKVTYTPVGLKRMDKQYIVVDISRLKSVHPIPNGTRLGISYYMSGSTLVGCESVDVAHEVIITEESIEISGVNPMYKDCLFCGRSTKFTGPEYCPPCNEREALITSLLEQNETLQKMQKDG